MRATYRGEMKQEARWVKAASGTSPDRLRTHIADRELEKDTPVRWILDFKVPGIVYAMDLWGAEAIFRPFVPDGLELVDVYERDGKGYVDMKADPAWLLAVVGFVKAHWLGIVIAGFLITTAVKLISMWIKVVEAAFPWILLIIGAVVLLALMSPETRRKET